MLHLLHIIKSCVQKADLAIADLTINTQRYGAVDFSMPFMKLGIAILYKAPDKVPS